MESAVSKLHPLLLIGTRPECIKMAPLVHESRMRDGVEPIVCFTGQHREMVDQIIDYFELKADIDLALMKPDQSLSELSARCISSIDRVLLEREPDYVVAQGDTTTVMAASVAAFFCNIPFVHVEAGLRTGDLMAPWPEEFNRRVASITAAIHCAPTQGSADNLIGEGVDPSTVHVTGNTVIDALLWTRGRECDSEKWRDETFSFLGDRRMVLITGHRRESFGGGFDEICNAIAELSSRFDDVAFVYPVHLNPNVQKTVRETLSNRDNVYLIDPIAYPAFVWLMDRATVILTDSGGIQEEAPSLRKPVVVMRDTTERPEAVDAGAAQLVGTSSEKIVATVSQLLTDPDEYARRQLETSPYGDGGASRRIVDLMIAERPR